MTENPNPSPNSTSNPTGDSADPEETTPAPLPPAAPELFLPRLGDYLVEQNLLTTEELERALAHQKNSQDAGKPILLGQALLELDLIDPPDLDRAIVHQLTNLHFALQQSNRQLETRVQQRTVDLERRLQQIRASAEITQMAVSAESLTELFQRSVDLIVERFGYYSAAIYLVDDTQRYLQLAEAAGPFAAVLRQRKPRIMVGSRSVIGWVAANNRPRLVADISQDFLAGDYETTTEQPESLAGSPASLSQTRSETAVPIAVQMEKASGRSANQSADPLSDRFYFHRQAAEAMLPQGRVLGVLDVQSEFAAAFDQDVVAVFQTIASHIAAMIHNARLLESARISLTETMVLYRAGQEFTRAHNVKEVQRSLWNALSDLGRDSGFENMLLVPADSAASHSKQPARSDAASPLSTAPSRYLREYLPNLAGPAGSTGQPAAPTDGSAKPGTSFGALTTELLDVMIPAPVTDNPTAGGSPFLILDTGQPSTFPAPLVELTVRLKSRTIALVPVRSQIGGQLRVTALIVTSLASATQQTERPAVLGGISMNSDYLVQTCVSLAELASGAFVRVSAAEVMEKRLAALQSLNTISQYISAKMDLFEVYQSIHSEVTRIMGDVNFLIALYNPATNYIQVPYLYESGRVDVRAIPPFPLGEGLTSILIKTVQPLMIVENTEERARQLGAKTVGSPSKSWLGVPLHLAGEVYGAIVVQDLEHEYRFNEDDQNLLVTLASQVAIAIRTARLLESVSRQAERQEMLNRITTRIRSSNDMQSILEIAANELRNALAPAGIARVSAGIEEQAQPLQANDTPRDELVNHV